MPEGGAPASLGHDLAVLRRRGAVVQFTWLLGSLAAWTLLLLRFPLDPDYTAGELLDHLESWRETGVLYPSLEEGGALRVLNYPPFVLLLVRAWTSVGVPPLLAGRVVNGVAVLLVLVTLAWWLRARGARGTVLLGSVGLLGASLPFLYASGQFHLEVWAVLGTLAGFALLDKGEGRVVLVFAGALLAAGCLAKQTQVVPALVALIWVARSRSGSLREVLAGFSLIGGVGVWVITASWGPEAWRHLITYTAGTYSLGSLAWQMTSHFAPWLVLIGTVGFVGMRGLRSGERGDPAWWYWCGALVWSLSAARDGAGYPYFLDLHIATALLAGPVIFGDGGPNKRGRWARLFPWLFVAQIVGADIGAGSALVVNLRTVQHRTEALGALCPRFQDDQPALVEEAGLARACGLRTVIHPFIMTSLANRGLWDSARFEERIARGDFPAAVVGFDPAMPVGGAQSDRWTVGMIDALRTAENIEAVGGGWWLLTW